MFKKIIILCLILNFTGLNAFSADDIGNKVNEKE